MTKVIIAILSVLQEPYTALMDAQHKSWDSVGGVDTFYYHGGGEWNNTLHTYPDAPWRHRVEIGVPDEYYRMHVKFRHTLQFLLHHEWNIMFRTNNSSYVNKEKLLQHAATLPKTKLYSGSTLEDLNDFSGLCVSGAGIFLSRDCAEILCSNYGDNVEMEEDVYTGRILRANGIVAIDDKSRIDYPNDEDKWREAYHVRFKTYNRLADAEHMIQFHKKLFP